MTTSEPLRAARHYGVSLLGAGGFASDLAHAFQKNGIQVHGFLTTFTPTSLTLNGLPVRRLGEEKLATPLAIGIFNREGASDYGSIASLLNERNIRAPLLWPQQSHDILSQDLGFRYWLHPRSAYANEEASIALARSLLEDETSRLTYDQILRFRRDDDYHWRPPTPDQDLQYLPSWLQDILAGRQAGPIQLVDAGAYHGETLRSFSSHLTIQHAWAFEPDPTNYSALVQALRNWPGSVSAIPAALGQQRGSIAFCTNQGEASHVDLHDGSGTSQSVPATSLDEVLHDQHVDLIKFDIEGHERPALQGAIGTLERCRPILAIAAYHRWDDLWLIPIELNRLGLGYRFRIGVHGHNSFDTVLYAY